MVFLIVRRMPWKPLLTALKFDLLTAYVDELSAPYLEDAEIHFVTDQLGSQLTLKAPTANA